jgi:hypothetical protein
LDLYLKHQQWDAASLLEPVVASLQSYRKRMDPPTERWSVFPTIAQRALAELV